MAGDTEPGAQSGELAGDGAGRGQRAGRVQRGDDVAGPVADKRAQVGRAGGRLLEVVLREGRPAAEDPGGDDVEQELAGTDARSGSR